MERLQKLIAHSGVASRRKAEEMIREGRVVVDGEPAHLGQKVDPETARVRLDGLPLPIKPGLVHYLVYKPAGVVSTAEDTHGRPTVVDLVPSDTRVYPAGRLDMETEGLIVVTNDGDLARVLTHPSHGVTKTYVARVAGRMRRSTATALENGLDLEDGPAAAVSARIIDVAETESLVEVVMSEGRNHEVRRMLAASGHEVLALVRVAIGPIRDGDLQPGRWRHLSSLEVRSLWHSAEETG